MKELLKNISTLMEDETIDKIELVKVDDNKVEIWSGGKYYGRQIVEYEKKRLRYHPHGCRSKEARNKK